MVVREQRGRPEPPRPASNQTTTDIRTRAVNVVEVWNFARRLSIAAHGGCRQLSALLPQSLCDAWNAAIVPSLARLQTIGGFWQRCPIDCGRVARHC